MRTIATALVILYTTLLSCHMPRKAGVYTDIESANMLYWCKKVGRWPTFEERPDCKSVTRGEWDTIPIIVNSERSLMVETMQAIEAFNTQVGFELFKYSITNAQPDVAVVFAGPHKRIAAEAVRATAPDLTNIGVIFVYDLGTKKPNVVMHELGHIVGLKHDKAKSTSLMFTGGPYVVPHIERDDVRLLRFVYLTRNHRSR